MAAPVLRPDTPLGVAAGSRITCQALRDSDDRNGYIITVLALAELRRAIRSHQSMEAAVE